MDPELKAAAAAAAAAAAGDVEFLIRAVESELPKYFTYQELPEGDNFMHIAVSSGQVKFLRVAMEMLDSETLHELLSHTTRWHGNYLHFAVHESASESLIIVGLALDFYRSSSLSLSFPSSSDDISSGKPWLAVNGKSQTPLHLALFNEKEEVAMEIMSMDMELLCNMVDEDGRGPLFLAVENGMNRVAEKILTSSFSYSLQGSMSSTPLHVVPKSSENVCRLLLQKHPNLLDEVDVEGRNVLHKWVRWDGIWPLRMLLEEFSDEKIGPEMPDNDQFPDYPLWKSRNKDGDTPLNSALLSRDEELAFYFLELDPTLCRHLNDKNESPLLIAASGGLGKFVKRILEELDLPFSTLRRYDGVTLLHMLPYCPEETGKLAMNKFWWMINLRDDMGNTAFDIAKKNQVPWLIKLLMNPSLIEKEKFNWVKACEAEETWPILGYIDTCPDLQQVYLEDNDTPLHHIKMQSYGDYLNFLKISSIAELKNTTDAEGATPLHRALERRDILLAKALLVDNGVERNMKDCHGTTAMDLLATLCKQADGSWANMCNRIKVNPYLKTKYIQPGTNMDTMRSTLSVVAALLATITFTAGFTLPGGLTDDGHANKEKNASFIVFLIADAYAMCTSILVLFCLIWSMVSTRDISYFLVDRSVWILMQSLYGTIVAFMTGVYSAMTHSSLWAIIVVFVMCSFTGIAVEKTFLQKVLSKSIPTTYSKLKD